ncbi:MAG: KAP family NTPase, partial [Elioraea sp.]|nr:KAP family NTPase [Elioraea sp.]
FAADQPAAEDALGRREEARRLAELACLKANAPPLAIGLFGAWGAGKSTFMRLMEEEIEAIARRWRADPASPFVTRVARLRFNAWSYADANLWASLAVEIFTGLRDEIARIDGSSLDKADALLAEISGRRAEAQERLEMARADAQGLRAARDGLTKRIEALDRRLDQFGTTLERAARFVETRRADILESLRAVGARGADEAKAAEA